MFEKIKRFYSKGLYSATQVYAFVNKGIITAEQYNEIVGAEPESEESEK